MVRDGQEIGTGPVGVAQAPTTVRDRGGVVSMHGAVHRPAAMAPMQDRGPMHRPGGPGPPSSVFVDPDASVVRVCLAGRRLPQDTYTHSNPLGSEVAVLPRSWCMTTVGSHEVRGSLYCG